MAQRLAELCKLFVENAFGDLAAQIFSTLASRGRLTLGTLRLVTGIPVRRLKTIVAVLIQHHIVLHHAAYEDEPTYFQVDWHAAYTLVRTRKFVQLVRDREGEAASQLLASVLQLGHVNVGDLAEEYHITPPSKRDSGIDTVEEHVTEEGMLNGIAKDKPKIPADNINTMSDLHQTLIRLLEGGYLLKVTKYSCMPPADLQETMKEKLIAKNFKDGKITGPKTGQQFQAALNELKRKRQDEESYSERKDAISKGKIIEPKASCSKTKNKRVKTKTDDDISNGIDSSDEAEVEVEVEVAKLAQTGVKLSNDTVLRVNFQKCVLLMRSRRFERMVDRYLGPVTAAVYRALLQAVEGQVSPLRDTLKIEDKARNNGDKPTLLSASDAEVLRQLDPFVDLAVTLKGAVSFDKLPNGVGKHHDNPHIIPVDDDGLPLPEIKKEEDVSDHEDGDKADEHDTITKEHNHRLELLNQHLCLIAEHPKHLCTRNEGATITTIDASSLAQTLINTTVDSTANARFGTLSTRIVRILRSSDGKLTEQQIASMSMQRTNDVRAPLTLLQFHGIVDCQELPKDGSRQTAKIVYLWWFDDEGVRRMVLEKCYVGMTRCLERLRWERDERFRGVVEKMEIVGEELLSQGEKGMIEEWRAVEERLLVQVERLDEMVALLRDYSGKDSTLMI